MPLYISPIYSARNEPKGARGFGAVPMAQLEPLLNTLRELGAKYACTPAQVCVCACMCVCVYVCACVHVCMCAYGF